MSLKSTIVGLFTHSTSAKKVLTNHFDWLATPSKPPPIHVNRIRNLAFERFAQEFVSSEPEILFTCEYFVEGEVIGCLLVWEKFADATHYEVFKQNIFRENTSFERILFLDTASLTEERVHFADYIKDTLGFNLDPSRYFVILDTSIKKDRVYEYKVTASRVPKNATEVDYDMIMEGKEKVKKLAIDATSSNNIFDFAENTLGSRSLAWILCLLNERLTFFGKGNAAKPIASLLQNVDEPVILSPNNTNDVMAIVNESILLFGVVPTFEKLISQCNGLTSDYINFFLDSIDVTKVSFSYDKFKSLVKAHSPVFSLILEVSTSEIDGGKEALSKLSISVPSNTGTESLTSIEGITKVFRFVNTIFRDVLFAQDKSTLKKIQNVDFVQDTLEDITSGDIEDVVEGTVGALKKLLGKK